MQWHCSDSFVNASQVAVVTTHQHWHVPWLSDTYLQAASRMAHCWIRAAARVGKPLWVQGWWLKADVVGDKCEFSAIQILMEFLHSKHNCQTLLSASS